MINIGDIVRLKKPHEGYTYGIVAEIVSTFHKKISVARFGGGGVLGVANIKDESKAMPRNVSLYLFKPGEDGGAELLMATEHIPKFCDFHVSELVLIKKANEAGYGEKEVDIAGVLGLDRCPECGENFGEQNPAKHLMDKHGWSEEKAAVWLCMNI